MGLIYLPPQKYKCSKCGSENAKEYSRRPVNEIGRTGTYEGVRCLKCGHAVEHYKMSIWEEETQTKVSYSYNPNKPKPF